MRQKGDARHLHLALTLTSCRSLKLDYIAERDEVDSLLVEMKRLEERLHDTEKDLDEETERASAVPSRSRPRLHSHPHSLF